MWRKKFESEENEDLQDVIVVYLRGFALLSVFRGWGH